METPKPIRLPPIDCPRGHASYFIWTTAKGEEVRWCSICGAIRGPDVGEGWQNHQTPAASQLERKISSQLDALDQRLAHTPRMATPACDHSVFWTMHPNREETPRWCYACGALRMRSDSAWLLPGPDMIPPYRRKQLYKRANEMLDEQAKRIDDTSAKVDEWRAKLDVEIAERKRSDYRNNLLFTAWMISLLIAAAAFILGVR